MGLRFSILFSLIISMSSAALGSANSTPAALDSLQKVLPTEIQVGPKLSSKDTLSTVFMELSNYVDDHSPFTDSKNFTSTWSSKNDQQLIQVLIQNSEYFLTQGELEIQKFFEKRLKKIANESPEDLWTHFTDISILFPNNLFWTIYFENQLNQPNIDWSKHEKREWIKTSLLPKLNTSMKPLGNGNKDVNNNSSKSNNSWNRNFLSNLLTLLIYERNNLLQPGQPTNSNPASKSEAKFNLNEVLLKGYINLIENIDDIFDLTNSKLQNISMMDTQPLLTEYYDFLQKGFTELLNNTTQNNNTSWLWNQIQNLPQSLSTNAEAMIIQTLNAGLIQKKLLLNSKIIDRMKAFASKYPAALDTVSKVNYKGTEQEQLSHAMNSVFYLRTLINLKTQISLPNEPSTVSKGQWLTKNHFQKSNEARWYEDLIEAQETALRLTQLNIYSLSLVDKCYKENLDTPTCQNWKEKFPLVSKESINEEGQKTLSWEVRSEVPIQLPPGNIRLAPHENLRIFAPEINFTYLTRIEIPSGIVEIQTNKITAPWIDVSGQNGNNGFTSQSFPGQKPWIKKSKICITRDYLEGATLSTTPRKNKKIDWVGFTIKNPLPKNISVCESNALQSHRDEVGDISNVIDIGLPPELVTETQPNHGENGGKLRIELTTSSDDKSPSLTNALLISMGGDGSQGRRGQDSPLCHQGKYQSFKVGLSHHKQWFQNWIDYLNKENINYTLTSKGEYGDHWYGVFELNLPRTAGSSGGNAGAGGEIELFTADNSRLESKPARWWISAGIPGMGGTSGSCGPNLVSDGKEGNASTQGKISTSKKQMVTSQ